MQNRFSPLRYPGGKGKITAYVRELFQINGLNDGHYMEPYAGGSAVALALLFLENASQIHINDFDRSIYAFWHSVLNETDDLCSRISSTRVNVTQWQRQKEIQRSKATASLLDLGYSTFFLNRTNRSGIINGGIIGGINQTGEWKIDARFNKEDLINRIQKIASFSSRINLYNMDACDLLKNVAPRLPSKSLIYLDPPYYAKGNRLYQAHYKHYDHAIVGKLIQERVKHHWMVSYDNVQPIKDIYAERRQLSYSIGYSAREIYNGSEVMIFSDSMQIPQINNPVTLAA